MNYISSEFAKESSNFDFSSWLQQRAFRVHIWNISIPKGLMEGQHTLTLSCGVAITALFFSFLIQRTIFWERQVPSSPLVSLWYHCAQYSYDKVAIVVLSETEKSSNLLSISKKIELVHFKDGLTFPWVAITFFSRCFSCLWIRGSFPGKD